jgi:hypothetical protein
MYTTLHYLTYRRMVRFFLLVFVALTLVCPPQEAKAEAMREFVLSCSYGVLAGTLVGAATLAFSSKPGDNLNKIARGASLGLYAGIILGLYVVYGGPGESEDDLGALGSFDFGHSSDELRLTQSAWGLARAIEKSHSVAAVQEPKVLFQPLLSEMGVEGVAAQMLVLTY